MFLTVESVPVRLGIDRPRALWLSLPAPLRLATAAQCAQPLAGTPASAPPSGPEFQNIVGGTDQRPFPAHLPHPSQQELAEAAALFDLAEHRLDNRFALGIQAPAPFSVQGAPHPVGDRQSDGRPAPGYCRDRLAMTLAIRRDERGTPQGADGGDDRLAEIA